MYRLKKRLLTRPLEGYIEDPLLKQQIIQEHMNWLRGRWPSEIKLTLDNDTVNSPIAHFVEENRHQRRRNAK
jgi:hypothetical protein